MVGDNNTVCECVSVCVCVCVCTTFHTTQLEHNVYSPPVVTGHDSMSAHSTSTDKHCTHGHFNSNCHKNRQKVGTRRRGTLMIR